MSSSEGQDDEKDELGNGMRADKWLAVHLHVLEGDLDLLANNPKKASASYKEARSQLLALLSPFSLEIPSWIHSGDASFLAPILQVQESLHNHPLVAYIASRQG